MDVTATPAKNEASLDRHGAVAGFAGDADFALELAEPLEVELAVFVVGAVVDGLLGVVTSEEKRRFPRERVRARVRGWVIGRSK